MAGAASRAAGARAFTAPAFETIAVSEAAPYVAEIAFNRPKNHNAMNKVFWAEVTEAFDWAAESSDVRAVSQRHHVSRLAR